MEPASRPTVDLATTCACGAVSVRFAGRVLSMFMCSCEDCQKATGTGHSAILLARPADVAVRGDTTAFARTAESGALLTRHFCPICGTPLFAQSSRARDVLMLPVGLFGAAAAAWYVPNQLIFARSHREWDLIPPGLPQHETYRDKGAAM